MSSSESLIKDFLTMVVEIIIFLTVVSGLYLMVYTIALNTNGMGAAADGLVVVVPVALGAAIVYIMYHRKVEHNE